MGGAVEAVTGAFSDVVEAAADVTSVVTDLGTEFLSSEALGVAGLAFGVPTGPGLFSSFGAFDVVGSFAGNASWFDAFNPGQIISQAADVVSGGGIGGGLELPGLGNLNFGNLPGVSDFGQIASTASQAVRSVSTVVGPVASAASALGVQVPGLQVLGQVNRIAGTVGAASTGFSNFTSGQPLTAAGALKTGASLIGAATGVTQNSGFVGAKNFAAAEVNDLFAGINILTDTQANQLIRQSGVNPLFVNGLVDPGTQLPFDANSYILNQADLNNLKNQFDNEIAGAESNIREANANIVQAQAELDDPNISDERRAELNQFIENSYASIATNQESLEYNQNALTQLNTNIENEVALYTQASNQANRSPAGVSPSSVTAPGDNFVTAYDPETGRWSVFNTQTGATVATNLSEQQALLATQDLNIGLPAVSLNTSAAAAQGANAAAVTNSVPSVNLGNTEPNQDTVRQAAAQEPQTNIQNLVQQARQQQAARAVKQNQAQASDWRVRLRLAPNSNYLYNDPSPGILAPLSTRSGTDGIIFPYTPSIDTAYKANYDTYDLTHSNYRGYFYKNSYADAVNIRATFTAQDTVEANYLLAVIHFFRSVTKMFYGQDPGRGSPPPLVYLSGYGDYQFNEHPSVVSQFNYTLPPDVDYIRAYSTLVNGENLLPSRNRRSVPGNPLAFALDRLINNKLTKGAETVRAPMENNLAINAPTYVPTKMEIAITLLPMQSRQQVSQQFSVKNFANGNSLRAGFW